MAENLLSDARVRSASFERDGHYLPDGGGLRIRLLPSSAKHPKGARLCEYHFKLKQADGGYLSSALHLGTIGDPFVDAAGKNRPFALSDARKARDAARTLVSRGIDPRTARRLERAEEVEAQRNRLAELDSRRTVRQAFGRWEELYLAAHRKDGGQLVRDMFDRHVLPVIGDLPLEVLRRAQVADVLDRITASGKRRTANMTLSLLRQFLRWCAVRDWISSDPTLALSKAAVGGKEAARTRALSPLEVTELRDKLPASGLTERMVNAVWLILATGCRVGELSGAKAAEFDVEARLWTIPETKSGRSHVVHLSEFALERLAPLLAFRGDSEYLLPGRDPAFPIDSKLVAKMVGDRQRETPLRGRTKAVATLLLARGKWTPHDLRRTMATRMREDLGVSSDVIEKCLNHVPAGIIGTYQTGELMEERRLAFKAWGRRVEELLQVDATNVVEISAARAAA